MIDLSTKDTGRGPQKLVLIVPIYFEPSKEDNLSTKDKTVEFIQLYPRVLYLDVPLYNAMYVANNPYKHEWKSAMWKKDCSLMLHIFMLHVVCGY